MDSWPFLFMFHSPVDRLSKLFGLFEAAIAFVANTFEPEQKWRPCCSSAFVHCECARIWLFYDRLNHDEPSMVENIVWDLIIKLETLLLYQVFLGFRERFQLNLFLRNQPFLGRRKVVLYLIKYLTCLLQIYTYTYSSFTPRIFDLIWFC